MSRASLMGFPESNDSITANSFACSCINLAIRKIYFPRSAGVILDQTSRYALSAAITAASTSCLFACATLAKCASSCGFVEGK